MSRLSLSLLCTTVALLCASNAAAQVTMAPLPGFGTNGWLAPGSSAYLGTGGLERGLAYNPTTGNLVLVSRAGGNNIRVLNGTSGADLGGLDNTGLTGGGTFPVNMCGIGDDGFIYVSNLVTSAAGNFVVYGWTSETAGLTTPPITIFNASTGISRIGDAFAVTGNFPNAQFAAAGSSIVSASNFAVGALDTTSAFVPYLSVPGTTTANNDYRLGLTFVDSSTIIGTQGATGRMTIFNGVSATVTASIPLGGAPRRAMDYAVIGGTPVLAVIDTNTSIVTLLNLADPNNPLQLAQSTTTTGTLIANGNGTGSVAWGPIVGNTATLYAMSSNQGIQAFTVTFNPLASTTSLGAGCDGYAMVATGLPSLGNPTFSLDVSSPILAALPFAFVAWGSFPVPTGIDLTGIGMPGCFSYTSFDLGLFATLPVVGITGNFPLAIPSALNLAGVSLAAQGVGLSVTTPAGLAASNGMLLNIGF